MARYVILKENKVVRFLECESPSDLQLEEGEVPHMSRGNFMIGDTIFLSGVPLDHSLSHFPQKHRRSYKDMIIGAAIAGGIGATAAAIQYFL